MQKCKLEVLILVIGLFFCLNLALAQKPIVLLKPLILENFTSEDSILHNSRFYTALAVMFDSMSMERTFDFLSYKDSRINKPTFEIECMLSIKHGREGKYYNLSSHVKDNYTGKVVKDFGCDAMIPNNLKCFAYDPVLQDSTNYRDLKINLGYTTIQHLIPIDRIIKLETREKFSKELKSFSINTYFQSSALLTEQAKKLTEISNNAMFFNQFGYPGVYFKRTKKYVYYDNYHIDKKTKADIKINARVTEDGQNYKLHYSVEGKDVNLVVPNPVNLILSFDKARLDNGDYSEAGKKINVFLKEIILMNTLF